MAFFRLIMSLLLVALALLALPSSAEVLPSFSESPPAMAITSTQPTSAVTMLVNVTNPMLWMSATVSVSAGLMGPATFSISLLFNTTEITSTNRVISNMSEPITWSVTYPTCSPSSAVGSKYGTWHLQVSLLNPVLFPAMAASVAYSYGYQGGALSEIGVPFQASLYSPVVYFDLMIDELSETGSHYDVAVQVSNSDGSPVKWLESFGLKQSNCPSSSSMAKGQLSVGVTNATLDTQTANFTNISPGSWHLALYSDEANSAQQFVVSIGVTSFVYDFWDVGMIALMSVGGVTIIVGLVLVVLLIVQWRKKKASSSSSYSTL